MKRRKARLQAGERRTGLSPLLGVGRRQIACLMPVRFLSDAELAPLSSWPNEIADDDLVTYFTLVSDDLGWLVANVRVENRFGAADQLCALP